ncbi:putative tryptophan halogenase [Synechococcus phage S-B64]|uniref:Putative tryptophan halogenase n=2 Tax=Shandvirus TaxID=2948904 RepID=A0A1Z1LWL6_9CAUD|nr:tryptophan halogenase [Synechococcus phage S-H35]YP_010095284.1 tryptophan halogenase [Synechococcus phage S-B64]ARW57036.1 putative tryptophan halogenase [Synechococcus phage S-H35]AWD90082.1 putative tryptophan halogenase [Synechococcus phage S-B64]
MMKTEKIVIVGGGTAGWMTAATIVATHPYKQITVVESPDVPRIGVGESTLQLLRSWMHVVGIQDSDFMAACDATYKLSVKFTGFSNENDKTGFHYPFGSPHFFPDSYSGLNDWRMKKALYPNTPVQDFAKSYYPQMALIDAGKLDYNEEGKFGNFDVKQDSAFHVDAVKFANWLRDEYCIPRGVNHIPATVTSVDVGEEGIERIYLDDAGRFITSDVYIDCTGFKSLLIGDALGEEFVSFNDQLPNNRAWAARVPYSDKETEMKPYTDCVALSNGWVWNTPTWTRIGMGYVYSDNYVSKEDALQEFKDHLVSLGKEIDDLEFRDLSFRVGIHKRTWVKNCIAIGLSAGFMEPLEGNGLLTIHEFALKLVRILGREYITQYDRDIYNTAVFKYFSEFADFVSAHYVFSQRRDTPYWKDTAKIPLNHRGMACDGARFMGLSVLKDNPEEYYDGMNFVAIGLGYDRITPSMLKEIEFYNNINAESIVGKIDYQWNQMKAKLHEFARECPSHYQFLKDGIYANVPEE